MTHTNNHINYIEFKANDLQQIKSFYQSTFNWVFEDYGPDYTAFSSSGLEGGFERSDKKIINGALVVLYHNDLKTLCELILKNGGTISQPVFEFPGGKRFHFLDPSNNELAVWSEL